MRSRGRLKHAALIAGVIVLAAVGTQPRSRRNQPGVAQIFTAAGQTRALELPRLHPIPHVSNAIPAAAEATRQHAPGPLPRHDWAAEVPVPGASGEAAAPPATTPAASGAAPAIGPPPLSDTDRPPLAQLIVCHPDAESRDAADAIQECINRAPVNASVEIPPGTYVLTHQLMVNTPMTIRTARTGGSPPSCTADESQCAVLVAAPDLLKQWGPLLVWSTNSVTLEHLVIDGNAAARATSIAAHFCLTGDNTYGFNAAVLDCAGCSVTDLVSKNALCGSGMVWTGPGASIRHSAFRSNGDAASSTWADGLTLLYAPFSVVANNQFVDNSDVALIIGYGVDARVENNDVRQEKQPAFAGVMLDNFNSDDLRSKGDFRGAVIANNNVDCGEQLCTFGIQVGPHPWYPAKNIIGGEVRDNAIRGAKIGINVDGAGTWEAPTTIYANTVQAPPAGAYFLGCLKTIPAESINVAPTSIVDRRDDLTKAGSHLSESCQLYSDVAPD